MTTHNTPQSNQDDTLCGHFVSWWDGEYEGNCELPEGHKGPHYDGMSCYLDDGEEVELKSRPIPLVMLSIGYWKAGQAYQIQNQVLDGQNRIMTMHPESGVEIRIEVST